MPEQRSVRWEGFGRLRQKPGLAAIVVVACVLAVAGAGVLIGVHVWAHHHWRLARQAAEETDLPRAKEHLQECLRVWPRSAEAHFLMARVCRRGGDLVSARTHLLRAEELHWLTDALDLEYLLHKAEAGGIGPVDQALRSQLRAGHADAPLILEALVRGHLQINGLRDAYHYADLWVRNHPDDWQAYYHRAAVLHRLGHSHSHLAVQDYERAVHLKPDQLEVRLRLAQLLENVGRHLEALHHFRAYQERYPDSTDAAVGEVRCLSSLGKLADAAQVLDNRLRNAPNSAELCLLRGKLFLDGDEPRQALEWLKRAEKELGPRSAEFHNAIAQAYRGLGRVPEADRHAQWARDIQDDFRRVQEITKEVSEDDRNLALRLEAGLILARRGQLEDAGRWVISALRIDPRNQDAREALAKIMEQTGDPRLAELSRGLLQGKPASPSGRK